MTILIDRIEKASTEDKNVMMMGDANINRSLAKQDDAIRMEIYQREHKG